MKALYLDHNIVRYFIRGFPPSVDEAAERRALQSLLSAAPRVRFVLTDWHLVEAARECAHAPDPNAEGDRYADWLEDLQPLYLEGHRALERAEMADFTYAKLGLRVARQPGWMFATEFSQIALSQTPDILVGFTARIYLRHLIKTAASRAEIHQSVGVSNAAQQTGIDAHNDGRHSDPAIQEQINRKWLQSLQPERDANKRWITVDRIKLLVDKYAGDLNEVLQQCPAMLVESVMTELRGQAGGRKAKPQDSLDLMHIVPALAYCDAFVTNDGPLRIQARKVIERTGRNVIAATTLTEAATSLA